MAKVLHTANHKQSSALTSDIVEDLPSGFIINPLHFFCLQGPPGFPGPQGPSGLPVSSIPNFFFSSILLDLH